MMRLNFPGVWVRRNNLRYPADLRPHKRLPAAEDLNQNSRVAFVEARQDKKIAGVHPESQLIPWHRPKQFHPLPEAQPVDLPLQVPLLRSCPPDNPAPPIKQSASSRWLQTLSIASIR